MPCVGQCNPFALGEIAPEKARVSAVFPRDCVNPESGLRPVPECSLCPLLLQSFKQMAWAIDLVLMGIGGCGLTIRPATELRGFPAGEEPRLPLVLPPGFTQKSALVLHKRASFCDTPATVSALPVPG